MRAPMSLLAYASLPLVLFAAYCAYRAARGRALKRYAVNVALGLILLGYFGVTTGLGIFWVARQELPVFDPHYLFGYLTALLVVAHVAVNFKAMSKFARTRAPRRLVAEGKDAWVFPVRFLATAAGLTAFGVACYWYGLGKGSPTVAVLEREAAALPRESGTSVAAESAGALPVPELAREQLVKAGKEGDPEVPVSTYYHRETTFGRELLKKSSGSIDWSRRPSPFKYYDGQELVPLPTDFVHTGMSTSVAVERAREPTRSLYPALVSLRELSTLLHMTNGLTGDKEKAGGKYLTRSAPSAGALYPTLTYVVARNVEGLAPGLYHYDAKGHALQRVKEGFSLLGDLGPLVSAPHLVQGASFALVFTTEYYRTSFKYGARSYRYSLLDAGHVVGNAMVAAEYLGLATRPLGRFDDEKVNALLGVDAAREAALVVLPVGRREGKPLGLEARPAFVTAPMALTSRDVPSLITLAHGRTMMRLRGDGGVVRPFAAAEPLAGREGSRTVVLPAPRDTGDDAFATIEKRRSARHWDPQGMDLTDLSAVLHATFGQTRGLRDPSLEDNHALRLYVAVLRVRGLDPGLYAYDGATHTLRLRREGDVKKAAHEMSLFQDCAGESDAVIVKTADATQLAYPDGSRGYRYASLDAGILGERLYLSTVALGLGTTGIGAYFDDEVSALADIDPKVEHVLYLSAIGRMAEK